MFLHSRAHFFVLKQSCSSSCFELLLLSVKTIFLSEKMPKYNGLLPNWMGGGLWPSGSYAYVCDVIMEVQRLQQSYSMVSGLVYYMIQLVSICSPA